MRFFLIDRITRWEVGDAAVGSGSRAEAIKNIALSEDFFDDHFPRRPVMPGALIVEGLAQLAGLLLECTLKARFGKDAKALMTVLERTKFRELVRPGDSLLYQAEVTSLNEVGGKAAVRAMRGDRLVATSGIVFGFKYLDDPKLDEKRRALMAVWMQPGT
jgi:3-hydroxyacyl-[acyl-carrier-protein] dehydratase